MFHPVQFEDLPADVQAKMLEEASGFEPSTLLRAGSRPSLL
jgi:hypothetical protein